MSELDSMKKPKRLLKNIKCTGIALTEESQGGACSLLNDAILHKANSKKSSDLSDNQREILESVDYPISDLDKSKDGTNTLSSSSIEGSEGEDNKTVTKGNSMTDEDKALLDAANDANLALKKELGAIKAESALGAFKFEKELEDAVVSLFVDLSEDSQSTFTKALEAVSTKEVEQTELQKSLSEEQGHEEEQEAVVKSLSARIADERVAQAAAKESK